jgi:nucleoid-associated protein YgaU
MIINGRITTVHGNAGCVASSLAPDNLTSMTTTAEGDQVTTLITGTQLRSVIASVDDYLMNLAIAEDSCSSFSHQSADTPDNSDRKTRSDTPGKNTVAGKKSTGRNSSR